MRKISIDELNEMVDSSYSLVTIISKRARQIIDGSNPLIETDTIKPVAIAIEEFHDEKYVPIYDYDKYKKEKEALELVEKAKELAEKTKDKTLEETEAAEGREETQETEETTANEE